MAKFVPAFQRSATLEPSLLTSLGARSTEAVLRILTPTFAKTQFFVAMVGSPYLVKAEGAQSHLENQGVTKGDIFLFFGWFRDVEPAEGKWRYKANSVDQHVIFGWLQVGEILTSHEKDRWLEKHPWLSDHPHLHGNEFLLSKNTLYVAKKTLESKDLPLPEGLPGGGVFSEMSLARTLTKKGSKNRSLWQLPNFFWPENEPFPTL